MCKALDKAIGIAGIALVCKAGGLRGDDHRDRSVSRRASEGSEFRSKRGGR
jgi:hypothetical protein